MAGGISAGRLEIEIVAEIARLQQDLDKAKKAVQAAGVDMGRAAKAANDNLRSIGQGVGQGVQSFSREVAQLKGQMEPAWAALQRYKNEVKLLQQALREGAITHKQYVGEMRKAVTAYQQFGSSAKSVTAATTAQRAGMQQLSYQLNDVATMYSMGARPMQIFASQSGQVIQAVQLMTGGTSKLAAFLGGPWGMAITAGTMILVPLIAKMLDSGEAAKEAESKTYDFSHGLDILALSADQASNALDQLIQKLESAISVQGDFIAVNASAAASAQSALRSQIALEQQKLSSMKADARGIGGAIFDIPLFNGGESGMSKVRKQRQLIDEMTSSLNKATLATNKADQALAQQSVLESLDKRAAATGKYNREVAKLNAEFDRRNAPDRDIIRVPVMSKMEYETRFRQLTVLKNSTLEQIAADEKAAGAARRGASSRKKLTDAERAAIKSAREAESLAKQRLKTAADYIDNIKDQIKYFGKSALEIQAMKDAEAAAAAPTAALSAEILKQAEALKALKVKEAINDFNKMILAIYDETELSRLAGEARDIRALALEKEAKMAEWAAQGLTDLNEKWVAYQAARMAQINNKTALERDAEAAELLNNRMGALLNAFSRLGGLAADIANIFGSKDPIGAMMGMGGVAGVIGSILDRGKTVSALGKEFTEALEKVLGPGGKKIAESLGPVMANAMQGASTGAAVGQVTGLNQTGSIVGGAIGQAIGGKVLGKMLGSFAGPVGAIVGSLLGGLVGSIFGGVSKGIVSITGSGSNLNVGGTKHSNGDRVAAATQGAGSVIDSMNQIAEALGGTINASRASVTIGLRKDQWVVDPTGQARTKGAGVMNFGKDEEAAIRAAMADLIKDGVIGGLREATERLLKGPGSIEQQLEKAVQFEAVFKALDEAKDPVAASANNLADEFARLKTIFDEAGASVAEYAKLQELYDIRLAELQESQASDVLGEMNDKRTMAVQILQLLGREEDALLRARQLEIAGLDDSLRAYQRVINTLTDARGVLATFEPLAASLREYRAGLIGTGLAADTAASLYGKFRSLADLAATGDATAMGKLGGAGDAYLAAARDNARTLQEYQAAVAQVVQGVDDGIWAADQQIDYAQAQIDAVNANTRLLAEIKADFADIQGQVVDNTATMARILTRVENGGALTIRNDEDTPLQTTDVTP